MSRLSGQGQGHTSVMDTFAGGPPSIRRQSYVIAKIRRFRPGGI